MIFYTIPKEVFDKFFKFNRSEHYSTKSFIFTDYANYPAKPISKLNQSPFIHWIENCQMKPKDLMKIEITMYDAEWIK